MSNFSNKSEAAAFLAQHTIEGMKKNAANNSVAFAKSDWKGGDALDVYTTEAEAEVAEAVEFEGAMGDAADRVQAWLDRGEGFKIDVQYSLDDAHHSLGRRYAPVQTVDSIGGAGEIHFIAWVYFGDATFGIDWKADRGTYAVVSEDCVEIADEHECASLGWTVCHMLDLYEKVAEAACAV